MSHTYSGIYLHIVFGTKDRRPLIDTEFRGRLYEYLCGLGRAKFGRILTVGGTENHVHGLVSIDTDISVGQAMSKWKSLSSGWLHKTFPQAKSFAWQEGYGAFSVSRSNVEQVARYIERQAEHHRTLTFEKEFMAILRKHEIEYDPKQLWGASYAG